MKNIIIPGFEELIPNSTYGKKGERFNFEGMEEVPATWLMQLAKYQVCNLEEVINLIQKAAVEYKGMSEEDRKKEYTGEAPVARFMASFPEDELQRIIDGNERSLEHLRNHYNDQKLVPGKYYLQVNNGIVPDGIIESGKDEIAKLGSFAYESMLSHQLANHWLTRLQLPEKDRLPNRRKIEGLLANRVEKSSILEVKDFEGEYKDFAAFFMNLYDALAKNGSQYSRFLGRNNLGKIEDSTGVFLRSRAVIIIKETAECYKKGIQMQEMSNALAGMLGKVIGMGVIEIPIKHERKPGYRFNPDKPSEN